MARPKKIRTETVDDVIAGLAGEPVVAATPEPEAPKAVAPTIEIDDDPSFDDAVIPAVEAAPALPRVTSIRQGDAQREIIQKMAKEASSGAERKRVDYSAGYDLSNLDLAGADFRSALMQNCDVSGTDFTGAEAQGINLTSAKVDGSIWNDADVRFAILPGDFKSRVIFNENTKF